MDEAQERRYRNEYHRLCSEHEIQVPIEAAQAENGERAINLNIQRKMYIFRNDWNEVVQVKTKMRIQDRGAQFQDADDGRYNCRIQVKTIKATIVQQEGAQDQNFTRLLKALSNAHNHNNMLEEVVEDVVEDVIEDLASL